ncbi:Holliday junction branch migration protein RuvA [Clostridium sp. DL1XJH146]
MYEYIHGIYIGLIKDYIIVENRDIGYKIFTSGYTISSLPKHNEKIKLFIRQIVREDFIGLYGFLTMDEREMFDMLLNINGVGTKAALSLLSISNVNNLKLSIVNSDIDTLIKAPGIGKKTAQRIILELKDKLHINEEDFSSEDINNIKFNLGRENNYMDALGALVGLGYSEAESKRVLKKISLDKELEEIIKEALKLLIKM